MDREWLYEAIGPHSKFLQFERFGDKIVCSVSKAAGEGLFAIVGCQYDYRYLTQSPLSLHRFQHLEAVQLCHAKIQDHQIEYSGA